MAKKRDKEAPLWRRIGIGRVISIIMSILILLILFSFLGMISLFIFGPMPEGNIAVIPIEGRITGGITDYGSSTSSSTIVKLIEEADENTEIKAILLEINSGGGGAVASDEIAAAVKKVEKPTVAVIREIGTSGAYWVASASDRIYANRMSITGSIGVIASYLEFAEMLDDYNITYRRIVSGEHKDMGSPFKEMTEEEEQMFQGIADQIHDYFVMSVSENRGMEEARVREIATGKFFLGAEAMHLGLIDELGSMQDAVEYLEESLNITADLADYRPRSSFYSFLSSAKAGSLQSLVKEEGISVQT